MRIALIVNRVTSDVEGNLAMIRVMAGEACDAGAQLVVLPEAALTGLINSDVPEHDLALGQVIPGMYTTEMGKLCRTRGVWMASGLLEREGNCLYDTALLIDVEGEIRLKYRRIQPQWHGRSADPLVYRQGDVVTAVETSWGRVAFLICGDLFDDDVIERAQSSSIDWLLFPFARCFSNGTADQMRWDTEEMPAYGERIRKIGCTALMVNYLAAPDMMGGAFGGAFVVKGDGSLLAQYPLGRAGTLLFDVKY